MSSASVDDKPFPTTTDEPPTKKAKVEPPVEEATEKKPSSGETEEEQLLPFNDNVWERVFEFLGPGHYIFVASVCRKLKKLYTSHCERRYTQGTGRAVVFEHLRQQVQAGSPGTQHSRPHIWSPMIGKDTFYSRTFCSVSRAKYWNSVTSNMSRVRLDDACVTEKIAKFGNVEVLKLACDQFVGFNIDEFTSFCAAKEGNLPLLKYVLEHGCQWPRNPEWCKQAARNGHLKVLTYASEQCSSWISSPSGNNVCHEAVKGGQLGVLIWATNNGFTWNGKELDEAAERGNLLVLEFARSRGITFPLSALRKAALAGNLQMVKYFHSNGCSYVNEIASNAAMSGNLEIMKYLYEEKGCDIDARSTFNSATVGDHLEILKYLFGKGIPLPEGMCNTAIVLNSIEIAEWANDQGQPWTHHQPLFYERCRCAERCRMEGS